MSRSSVIAVLAVCLSAGLAARAIAGGGPENVLLVVNPSSSDSLTIANHYTQLRRIPAGNVKALEWDTKLPITDVATFRNRILLPVLKEIESRKLTGQIDYIVYSSGFPWGIKLQPDIRKYLQAKKQQQWPKTLPRFGSVNSLTYLYRPVMAGDVRDYVDWRSNQYMRLPAEQGEDPSTLGFKSSLQFGPRGELLQSKGRSYMLSMVLGVTTGRGNTVAEILEYLRRSATADGTKPKGTIYFVQNKSIRSKPRDRMFPAAVEALKKLGVEAKIVGGTTPRNKDDVQGVMIGAHTFHWDTSGSTIRPGAICDNFTSYGGSMDPKSGQTPLSEFLRYGAAGASGTVTEPYVITGLPFGPEGEPFQPRFPVPMMHVHYARGCTLAEAFYQSVYCPYMLLIVGDPLCRPWASIPQVLVEGVKPGASVKGALTLQPSATVAGNSKIDRFELFIDGWRRAACRPGGTLAFDTTKLADGYHELRVVAVEAGLIQSQGRRILPITTTNHGRTIEASSMPRADVRVDQPLVITAESPGAAHIVALHNSRPVGTINGEQGQMTVDTGKLGCGPVQLQIVGIEKSGPTGYVTADPITVTVEKTSAARPGALR